MKILHAPFTYFPDPVGGTEVYVASLVRELQARGFLACVAAPGAERTQYEHADVTVHRVRVDPDQMRSLDVFGRSQQEVVDQWAAVLDFERPDIFHVHARSPGVPEGAVNAACARGIATVFTYHTPTVTCQRGTLLRWGETPCDGRLRTTTCAACTLQSRGVPKPVATALGLAGYAVPLRSGDAKSRPGMALQMTKLTAYNHRHIRSFLTGFDAIVVPSQWTHDLLVGNGLPSQKLTLSRQGLDVGPGSTGRPAESFERPGLTLAWFGRTHPTKGLDIIVRAIREVPGTEVTLDVYPVSEYPGVDPLLAAARRMISDDTRITIKGPVASADVVATMRAYDCVVVPSQWYETGPLTVLEAFAAGRPVMGSKLAGIEERVTEGVDGLLVDEYAAPSAWAQKIRSLFDRPETVARLAAGVKPPRSMGAVAEEMIALYERIRSIHREGRLTT